MKVNPIIFFTVVSFPYFPSIPLCALIQQDEAVTLSISVSVLLLMAESHKTLQNKVISVAEGYKLPMVEKEMCNAMYMV